MKKYLFILFIFIFVSSTSATAYSQTSSKNTILGARSGETTTKAPPISQTLIREGDFAIKLVEALTIGQAQSEAEAESMLTTVGIAPQNGWIADYPVTPDIIGELEEALSEAADAKRLPMGKDEALKAFRTAAAELELPIIAELPTEVPDRYAESPSPIDPQYTEPSVIEDYYDAEGPPIVTYYPPPPDYYYLYAWIPSPFWYTGFYFPGFYVLRDFHRVIVINRHTCVITNHFRDHRTGRIFPIDPVRRHADRRRNHEYFDTSKSIPRHVHERPPIYNREEKPSRFNHRDGILHRPPVTNPRTNKNPDYSKSIPRYVHERPPIYNREERPLRFNHRDGILHRPPVTDQRINKNPGRIGPHGMSDRVFRQPGNSSRRSVTNLQRPSAGQTRSFSLPSRGSERSFSPLPRGEGKQFRSSPKGYRGFFKSQQGVEHNRGFGRRNL